MKLLIWPAVVIANTNRLFVIVLYNTEIYLNEYTAGKAAWQIYNVL